jgi:hypothetical protein
MVNSLIPQAIGLIRSFTVPNTSTSKALPSPTAQPKLSVQEIVRAMPKMSDSEVVAKIGEVLHSVTNSVPGAREGIEKALTGDPEKDTKTIVRLTWKLLTEFAKDGDINEEQANRILQLVDGNALEILERVIK